MSLLQQRKKSSILMALITIVLGLALIIFKDTAVRLICIAAGIALAVWGAYYIVSYFVKKTGIAALQMELFLGIILLLIGLWMALSPASVIGLIQYVVGILIIIHGAIDLQAALNIRRGGDEGWWISLLLAALTLAMGALVLINPFGTLAVLLTIIGVVLIFDGVSDLFIIFRLTRVFKDVKQAVDDAVQEAEAIETEGDVIDEDK